MLVIASNLLKNKASKIIHIDLDYFFAQVEELDNPSLKDKPFAIGGPGNRGVLSTCNYVARKFGVRSGMPNFKALEKCPQLILVPGSMAKYRKVSQEIFAIFHTITDKIESLSIDEAYVDATNLTICDGDAIKISDFLRKEILNKTGLTASAGVAPNKLLAKIASDINKPNGLFTILPEEVDSFMKNLKVEKLMGVGKATLVKLNELGIYTCEHLQELSIRALQQYFGKYGLSLYNYSRGVDNREVQPYRIEKSISVESTTETNLTSLDDCIAHINLLYLRLDKRIDSNFSNRIDSLFVKITSKNFTKSSVMHKGQSCELHMFIELFKKIFFKQNTPSLRLIGIGVGLKQFDHMQLSIDFNLLE